MPAMLLDPVWAAVIAAALGLCVGSFLNVVIHRLPKMMERDWRLQAIEMLGKANLSAAAADFRAWSATTKDSAPLTDPETREPTYNLIFPRSNCPSCQHAIRVSENIPVVSWLFLRGRCSECGVAISARYPLLELATGVVTGLVVIKFGPSGKAFAAAVLIWVLIALALIDFDTMLLPLEITTPLLFAGLALSLFPEYRFSAGAFESIVGMLVGYYVLWSLYWIWQLAFRKEGIGQGDFMLLAALGAWFGWQMLIPILLLSSVVGSLIGLSLIVFRGRDHQAQLPYGPFLAMGGVAAIFVGQPILRVLTL